MSKYMKMKKILCAGCAAAMAMSCFAGAAEISDISNAVEFAFTSKVETGTIKLTMNNTGDLYINPYGIDVTVLAGNPTASPAVPDTISTDQIISPTQFIKNESNTGLKVSITPTVKPSANVTVKPDISQEKGKAATIGFDIIESADGASEPADWTQGNRTDLSDYETTNGVLTNTGLTLARGDTAATYAAFRLQGTANANPVNDEDIDTPWTTDDTIEASLAFTFTPDNGAGGTITPGAATATLADFTVSDATGSATIPTPTVTGGDANSTWQIKSATSSDANKIRVTGTAPNFSVQTRGNVGDTITLTVVLEDTSSVGAADIQCTCTVTMVA